MLGERDGGSEMVSSSIQKPLPGTHSVLASRCGGMEGGMALGARESPECIPEYALVVMVVTVAVARD